MSNILSRAEKSEEIKYTEKRGHGWSQSAWRIQAVHVDREIETAPSE
jgi:hypothetical protein